VKRKSTPLGKPALKTTSTIFNTDPRWKGGGAGRGPGMKGVITGGEKQRTERPSKKATIFNKSGEWPYGMRSNPGGKKKKTRGSRGY